jgi:hypothetical protein
MDRWIIVPDDFCAPVTGSVVHDNNFIVAVIDVHDGIETGTDQISRVVRYNDNG